MITLYIKTHNETGLKYFGKTKRTDVDKYRGSGRYWTNHLKKYGNNVTTEIYAQFEYICDELVETATKFSLDNNIVESKEWANLRVENGLDGNGPIVTEEFRKRMSEMSLGRGNYIDENGNSVKICTIDAKRRGLVGESLGRRYSHEVNSKKASHGKDNGMYGKKHTEKTKEIIKKTWNNNRPILKCPHCGLMSRNNMKRYHFSNCKEIK